MQTVTTPLGTFNLTRRSVACVTVYKAGREIRQGRKPVAVGEHFCICHRTEKAARFAPDRYAGGDRVGTYDTFGKEMTVQRLPPVAASKTEPVIGRTSTEKLYHFQCGVFKCRKWWSVGDANVASDGVDPMTRQWYCPWCGALQTMTEAPPIARTH
jgi:hypothetical protein